MQKPSAPARSRYTQIASMKPPFIDTRTADKKIPKLVAVTEDGKELTLPCTTRVFGYVRGVKTGETTHSGLDVKIDKNFLLVTDPSTDLVINVHIFPRFEFARSAPPGKFVGQKTIDIDVDQTTGDLSIDAMPLHVQPSDIEPIIRALDQLQEVKVGAALTKKATVQSEQGNRLVLSTTLRRDKAITTLSAELEALEA